MANEITIYGGINISKNSATISVPTISKQITMANTAMLQNVQNIGTSTEALTLDDVASPGYFLLKNLGPDTIKVGNDSPPTFITLKNGEFAVFPSTLTAINAKAAATASNLMVVACEN